MAPGLASALLLLGLGLTSAFQRQRAPEPTNDCTGSRNKFEAGYGGCEVYSASRHMHRFCENDFDEDQRLYASQVCDECRQCTGGDISRKAAAKAYGDPHMTNILGQRFDLVQPGDHTLLQIPRAASQSETLLRVAAQVRRVGANCQDMYIVKVNVTGNWAEKSSSGSPHFEAGIAQHELDGKWLHFGPVDLKVAQGKTLGGTPYLNFFVRNLAKTDYRVGGLLGEDSHDRESTPGEKCHHVMSLLSQSEHAVDDAEGLVLETRSEAEAAA